MIFREDVKSLLLDAMPVLVCSLETGVIEFVTKELEGLFGYNLVRDELVGMPLEIIIPESRRECHAVHRNVFAANPHPRMMGRPPMNIEGRKRDGTVFPANVLLYPAKLSGQLCVVAVVLDATQ